MDVDKEHLSSQNSCTKLKRIDSKFYPDTSRSNTYFQINVSYSIHNMIIGNGGNGNGNYFDSTGNFGIVYNDDDVVNYDDVN